MSELTYSKQLSGILASFTVIVLLGANLFTTMTIDVSTMIFVLIKVLPIAFAMGFLGHMIGNILDNPKGNKKR
ncbi:hypothetical protein IJE86_01620 [bacterium]|nr:hypothetical protein [bacterium]